MWKPNKNGRYLHNGTITDIACAGTRVERTTGNISVLEPIWDGPWSLLSPDWQEGAPTTDQLERWRWWAIQYTNEDEKEYFTSHEFDEDLLEVLAIASLSMRSVRSAPIQPDLTNGPLWVPLEVCK